LAAASRLEFGTTFEAYKRVMPNPRVFDLDRFKLAQDRHGSFSDATAELRSGRKTTIGSGGSSCDSLGSVRRRCR
jgi:hypothetical protein